MGDLSWMLEEASVTAEELEWEHRMDISASIFARMKELGLNESELADKLDVNKSQVSRLIKGQRNITLSTLAALETALDFRLDDGFRYYERQAIDNAAAVSNVYSVAPIITARIATWNGAPKKSHDANQVPATIHVLEDAA